MVRGAASGCEVQRHVDGRSDLKPACARCGSTRVWTIREGTTIECADCNHQTSRTSGTLWLRAAFEISTRRTGISAEHLQRIMGFDPYKAPWAWLHKLRAAPVRPESLTLKAMLSASAAIRRLFEIATRWV